MEWINRKYEHLTAQFEELSDEHGFWRPAGRWGRLRRRWNSGAVLVADHATGVVYAVTPGSPPPPSA